MYGAAVEERMPVGMFVEWGIVARLNEVSHIDVDSRVPPCTVGLDDHASSRAGEDGEGHGFEPSRGPRLE